MSRSNAPLCPRLLVKIARMAWQLCVEPNAHVLWQEDQMEEEMLGFQFVFRYVGSAGQKHAKTHTNTCKHMLSMLTGLWLQKNYSSGSHGGIAVYLPLQ